MIMRHGISPALGWTGLVIAALIAGVGAGLGIWQAIAAQTVIPNQLIIAATRGIGVAPAHSRSSPALSGIMPVVRVRWPPADSPVSTIRAVSML